MTLSHHSLHPCFLSFTPPFMQSTERECVVVQDSIDKTVAQTKVVSINPSLHSFYKQRMVCGYLLAQFHFTRKRTQVNEKYAESLIAFEKGFVEKLETKVRFVERIAKEFKYVADSLLPSTHRRVCFLFRRYKNVLNFSCSLFRIVENLLSMHLTCPRCHVFIRDPQFIWQTGYSFCDKCTDDLDVSGFYIFVSIGVWDMCAFLYGVVYF